MDTIRRIIAMTLVLAALQTALSGENAAQLRPRFIKAGRLFTGTDDQYLEIFLEINDGKIVAVSPRDPGQSFLDLSDYTALPGLIDCHTHLAARADRYDEIYIFKDTPLTAAINSVANAKRLLEAGFTTIRDLGSPPFLAVDLRNAIEEGVVPGPRIVASGPYISMTGGHGDLNGFAPQVHSYMFERAFRYVTHPSSSICHNRPRTAIKSAYFPASMDPTVSIPLSMQVW
jgi:imidazolonepropionase-like amidohydrolase